MLRFVSKPANPTTLSFILASIIIIIFIFSIYSFRQIQSAEVKFSASCQFAMRQPATMICYLPHAFYYKWIYIYASQLNLSVFRCAFDMIILVLQHPRPKQNGKQKCGFTRRICKKANLNGKQICFNSNCFSVKKLNKPKVLIHFPKCMASIVNLVCLVGPLVPWSLNEFKFYAVHSNLKCRGVSYLPKQKCNQASNSRWYLVMRERARKAIVFHGTSNAFWLFQLPRTGISDMTECNCIFLHAYILNFQLKDLMMSLLRAFEMCLICFLIWKDRIISPNAFHPFCIPESRIWSKFWWQNLQSGHTSLRRGSTVFLLRHGNYLSTFCFHHSAQIIWQSSAVILFDMRCEHIQMQYINFRWHKNVGNCELKCRLED